jgi:hypothetical protein
MPLEATRKVKAARITGQVDDSRGIGTAATATIEPAETAPPAPPDPPTIAPAPPRDAEGAGADGGDGALGLDPAGAGAVKSRPAKRGRRPLLPSEIPAGVNPYARDGKAAQYSVSLYLPQWETIEQQVQQLREEGVADASITRWVMALLHFRAPEDRDDSRHLMLQWRQLEADDEQPYLELRRQPRPLRLYPSLWERQQWLLRDLARDALADVSMAMWISAVAHFRGPRDATDAKVLLRDWRMLLAGDPL